MLLLSVASIVLGSQATATSGDDASLKTLRDYGFEARSTGGKGVFVDAKSGFGGSWRASPFGGGDVGILLVLRFAKPLDLIRVAGALSSEERKSLLYDTGPSISPSAVGRIGIGLPPLAVPFAERWSATVARARRFAAIAGSPVRPNLSDAPDPFSFDNLSSGPFGNDPKPMEAFPSPPFSPNHQVRALGDLDLALLRRQYRWPNYNGGGGGSGGGSFSLWIGRESELYFWLSREYGPAEERVLPGASDALKIRKTLIHKDGEQNEVRLEELRQDFRAWTFEQGGTNYISAESTIDMRKGITIREIDKIVQQRMKEAARLNGLFPNQAL